MVQWRERKKRAEELKMALAVAADKRKHQNKENLVLPKLVKGMSQEEIRNKGLDWLRDHLLRRRIGEGRLFQMMDVDRSGKITGREFENGLLVCDVRLAADDSRTLWDSSRKRGRPLRFRTGLGQVNPGRPPRGA